MARILRGYELAKTTVLSDFEIFTANVLNDDSLSTAEKKAKIEKRKDADLALLADIRDELL